MTVMMKHELRRKLLTAVAELYQLQTILEHAVRAGVPPDANHVVRLDAATKQLCSILAELNEVEPDTSQKSA